MADNYTVEKTFEIRHEKDNITHWEIGQDRDGLDLVEIREYSKGSELVARMTFDKELAIKVALVLLEYCGAEI